MNQFFHVNNHSILIHCIKDEIYSISERISLHQSTNKMNVQTYINFVESRDKKC